MRDRIPVLFAALLVAALVAVVGVAAFTTSGGEEAPDDVVIDSTVSARLASAILAVSVSSPETTQAPLEVAGFSPVAPETTPSTLGTTSTLAPSTTAGDTTPPPLVITSPADGATVSDDVVAFSGTSEPGAVVTSGPFSATMADDGDWTIKLVVLTGYNSTVFTARDTAGNETAVRIVLYYYPPTTTTTNPPTTTTTKPPNTTTTTSPGSGCLISGSCSPQWPADPWGHPGREHWRAAVEEFWLAERVECVLDLIMVESSSNPQANNSGRYLGLMQHSHWAWNSRAAGAGFRDSNGLTAHPYNGRANIAAGAYLAAIEGSDWWRHWPPTRNIASCQAIGAWQ